MPYKHHVCNCSDIHDESPRTPASFLRSKAERRHDTSGHTVFLFKTPLKRLPGEKKTYLEVDAAGVAHERLAQGDTSLLTPDHAALQHQPVLVHLGYITTVEVKDLP